MKKRILIIVIVLIIVAAAITIIIKILNKNQEEIKVITQEELREAYYTQNNYLGLLVSVETSEQEVKYNYMPLQPQYLNIDGVECITYEDLAFYVKETGSSLTYGQLIDYLSQEFEDDGEVRIYINGQHPEIAAYLEWAKRNEYKRLSYIIDIRDIYTAYADENEYFPTCLINLLPIEMYDELVKKEADPNYNLDLKTIQDRYIAEGKAKVSEDGKTIEYIAPETSP